MYFSLKIFFLTMVSFCRNSLYSIISLVFLIVGCCFILFYLDVEFLTFILLLIYIGALSVLFLFVVKLLKPKKTLSINIHSISLFVLDDGVLNHLELFSLCFILFFLVYLYKIIKRKNLIIIISKSYLKKKKLLNLLLWWVFILPGSVFWVDLFMILFISIPMLSLSFSLLLLCGKNLPLIFIFLSCYIISIWVVCLFFVVLNIIPLKFSRRILNFLNNYFLRVSLKSFIGNSISSRLAKMSTVLPVAIPAVLTLVSNDYTATMDATNICINEGISPSNPAFNEKMLFVKAEVQKGTFIGSKYHSIASWINK